MAIKAADELAELLAKPYEDYAAWKANPTRLKPIWPVIQEVLKNWENRINSYDRIHLTAAYKIYALSKAIAIVIEKRFDVLLGDSPLKKLNGLQIKGYKESIEEAQEAVKQAIKNGKAVMDREETRIFRELLSTFQTQCWKTGIRKTKRTFLDSDLDLTLNNFWDTAQGIWRDPPPPSASWCYSPNDFQDIEQEVWLDDAAQEIGSYPLLPSLHHGQWW
jgi:hypothetical protein